MTAEQVERLLTWVIIGVVLGGRLGFVLFYQPGYYLQNPGQILRVWEGGMSFHGGFLGVVVAGILFCRRERIPMLSAADLMAVVAPIGIGLGRLANFINAELWGRPTTLPWGVAFPGEAAQACPGVVGICARHPSNFMRRRWKGSCCLRCCFGSSIGAAGWHGRGARRGCSLRAMGWGGFVVEFVRQPDAQFVSPGNPLGLAWQMGGYGLTMGQILSLPMIAAGLWFIARARRSPA